MKLEVGMYVRDIKGRIDKIIGFKGALIEFEKDLMSGYIDCNDFTKATYNIIDILEVWDYVNGALVVEIIKNNRKLEPRTMIYVNGYVGLYNEEIKTIITHEQIEQMVYKVDDE